MLPDRVSNPRPLTYKSGALPIALRGSALLGAFLDIPEVTTNTLISRYFKIKVGLNNILFTRFHRNASIYNFMCFRI